MNNVDFLLEKIYSNQETHNSKLEKILIQTTKHNGRLSKVEEKLEETNLEIERLKEKSRVNEDNTLKVKTGYSILAYVTGGAASLYGAFEILIKIFK